MNTKIIVPVVIAVLVCAPIGFYGGMKYAKGKSTQTASVNGAFGVRSSGTQQFGQGGAAGFRGGRMGEQASSTAGFVNGDILSKDASSMTVKLADGGSKIVLYSSGTQISKTMSGTADDLVVGKTVSVMGTANQDGSVTARSVQLRPTTMASTTRQ